MSERQTWQVEDSERLDHWLVRMWPWLDRDAVRDLIQSGAVAVNARRARKAGQYIEPGDQVTLVSPVAPLPNPDHADSIPATGLDTELVVLYEDEGVLIIDKPAELPLRPLRGSSIHSLAGLLSERYPGITNVGAVGQAGIVNRLDAGVSGPVLVAKDEATLRALKHLVTRQRLETGYTALVEGHLVGEGVIDAPLGNSKRSRERLAVAREGRVARTHYRVQRHLRDGELDYTLVYLTPESSRLHQLQVHMAWYGSPIVGDRRYGSRHQPLLRDRLFLHLSVLRVPHPATGALLTVESRLPAELFSLLQYLLRPRR